MPPKGLTGIALEAWSDKQEAAEFRCPFCGRAPCLGVHADCMSQRFEPKDRTVDWE